jgi:hypothetical protein
LGSVELELAEAKQTKDTDKQERLQHRKELITEQIDILETERRKLIQAKADLEKEAAKDYGSLDEELEELELFWPDYTFERRRTLINFVIREVVIDSMSTHWLKIEVLWLHEEWGREEMFYHRKKGKRKAWTTEEDEIVRAHYATLSGPQLMALLPDRTWQSIRTRGKDTLGIRRKTGRPMSKDDAVPDWATHYSYADLVFMREHNLEGQTRSTEWVPSYREHFIHVQAKRFGDQEHQHQIDRDL